MLLTFYTFMNIFLKNLIGMNKSGVMAIVVPYYFQNIYIWFFFLDFVFLWVLLYLLNLFLLRLILI